MKKIITLIVISTLMIAGCSSGKYADKIDKAVNKQQHYQKKLAEQHKGDIERKKKKKDANIYVYEKGKFVIIAYKPIKNDEEIHYYAYEYNDGKTTFKKDFNSKGYIQKHDPDYKEENMDLDE